MQEQQIKSLLFQFKRVHKRQIEPHHPVLSLETQSLIKRKVLKSMDKKEIKTLAQQILQSIDIFQKKRDKPHQGLVKFKQVLLSQLT